MIRTERRKREIREWKGEEGLVMERAWERGEGGGQLAGKLRKRKME